MTPSHAVKAGRRYRYYVSRPLITGTRSETAGGLRIPAAEIEPLVTGTIHKLLSKPARLSAWLAPYIDVLEQQRALRTAADLAARWLTLTVTQLRLMLAQIIRRIDVLHDRVELQVSSSGLIALLCACRQHTDQHASGGEKEPIVLSVPAQLQRAGRGMALIINDPMYDGRATAPDPKLVRLIARARLYRERLIGDENVRLSHIARQQRLNRSYLARIVQLSYLAPDIVKAILDGHQPRHLTVRKLVAGNLPLAWAEQRTVLGFSGSVDRDRSKRG